MDKHIQEIISKAAQARQRRATDGQMKVIWPVWNALPAHMLPEQKRWIVSGAFVPSHLEHEKYLCALQPRFPKTTLPLDPDRYSRTLDKVEQWSKQKDFIRTTAQRHRKRVRRQCAFAEADAHAAARVAIFRAAKEIRLTHPSLLRTRVPTLEQVSYLDRRFTTYQKARHEALIALQAILYKVSRLRTHGHLPFSQRAGGVPHPPVNVPRFLYIARLEALGVCSRQRLRQFLRSEYPHLPYRERQKFDRVRRKPRFGKESYAGFLVWVLDNRPVFELFAWQWKDIVKAAEAKHILCPKTCLKQWAYRNRVRLRIKKGAPAGTSKQLARSTSLLSPRPIFDDVLTNAVDLSHPI